MASFETAMVVLVPEAEPLVRPFRDRFDPVAAQGMPAHITINYPFLSEVSTCVEAVDELRRHLNSYPCFDFSLVRMARFPHVLHLVPEPDSPFKDLIKDIWDRYPQAPPYGGLFADIVPHLTVAQVDDQLQLERIQMEFTRASEGKLPIRSRVEEVWLMDNREGYWKPRISFGLSD